MSPRRNWDPPPTPLPPASVYPPPPEPREGRIRSPAGKGVGESQFGRQEKNPSTLSTLWYLLFTFCRSISKGVTIGSATRTWALFTTTCDGSIIGGESTIFKISTRCNRFFGPPFAVGVVDPPRLVVSLPPASVAETSSADAVGDSLAAVAVAELSGGGREFWRSERSRRGLPVCSRKDWERSSVCLSFCEAPNCSGSDYRRRNEKDNYYIAVYKTDK